MVEARVTFDQQEDPPDHKTDKMLSSYAAGKMARGASKTPLLPIGNLYTNL